MLDGFPLHAILELFSGNGLETNALNTFNRKFDMKKKFTNSALVESIASSMGRMFEYDGYSVLDEARKKIETVEPEDHEEDETTGGTEDLFTDEQQPEAEDLTQEEDPASAPADDDTAGIEDDDLQSMGLDSEHGEGTDTAVDDGGIAASDEENMEGGIGNFGLEQDEEAKEKEQIAKGNAIMRKINTYRNKWNQDFDDANLENYKQQAASMLEMDPEDETGKMLSSLVKDMEKICADKEAYREKYGYDFDEDTHMQMKRDWNERHNGKAEEEGEERQKEYNKSAVFPKKSRENEFSDAGVRQMMRTSWNSNQRSRTEDLVCYKVNGPEGEQIGMIPEYVETALKRGHNVKYNDDVIRAMALAFGKYVGGERGTSAFSDLHGAAGQMINYLYNVALSKGSLDDARYTDEERAKAKELAKEIRIQTVMAMSALKEMGNGNVVNGLLQCVGREEFEQELEGIRAEPYSNRMAQIERRKKTNAWRRDPLASADEILKAAIYNSDPVAKRFAVGRQWKIPGPDGHKKYKGIHGEFQSSSFSPNLGGMMADDSIRQEIDRTESKNDVGALLKDDTKTPDGVANLINNVLEGIGTMQLKTKFKTDDPADVYIGAFNAKLSLAIQHQVNEFLGRALRGRTIFARYSNALKVAVQPLAEEFAKIVKEGDWGSVAIDLNSDEDNPINRFGKRKYDGVAPDEEEEETDEEGNVFKHAWKYRDRTTSEILDYIRMRLASFVHAGGYKEACNSNPEVLKAIKLINRIETYGEMDMPVATASKRFGVAKKWKDAIEAARSGDKETAMAIADELENSGNETVANELRSTISNPLKAIDSGESASFAGKWTEAINAVKAGDIDTAKEIANEIETLPGSESYVYAIRNAIRKQLKSGAASTEEEEVPESYNKYERVFSNLYQSIFE